MGAIWKGHRLTAPLAASAGLTAAGGATSLLVTGAIFKEVLRFQSTEIVKNNPKVQKIIFDVRNR